MLREKDVLQTLPPIKGQLMGNMSDCLLGHSKAKCELEQQELQDARAFRLTLGSGSDSVGLVVLQNLRQWSGQTLEE